MQVISGVVMHRLVITFLTLLFSSIVCEAQTPIVDHLGLAKKEFAIGNYHNAYDNFMNAANSGISEAQLEIGLFYCYGLVVNISDEKAKEWFRKSAEQDNPFAKLLYSTYLDTDDELVEKQIIDQAKLIDTANSHYFIGLLNNSIHYYMNEIAEHHFAIAAEKGHIGAKLELAKFETKGDSTEFLERLANQGNVDAQFYLAEYFFDKEQIAEALKWYNAAADNDHSQALEKLTEIYRTGIKVEVNQMLAAQFANKALDLGHGEPAYLMALDYFYDKNLEKTLHWAELAASRGNFDGFTLVGELYEDGDNGIEQDISKALKWYSKGAGNGSAACMLALAHLYMNNPTLKYANEIPDENYEIAMMWLTLHSFFTIPKKFTPHPYDNHILNLEADIYSKLSARAKTDYLVYVNMWTIDHPQALDRLKAKKINTVKNRYTN